MKIKATGYDMYGKVLKCDKDGCSNEAGCGIVGLDSCANYCDEHSPFSNETAQFVYKGENLTSGWNKSSEWEWNGSGWEKSPKLLKDKE